MRFPDSWPSRHRIVVISPSTVPARLLAACDVFCALRDDRPPRPAYDLDVAASMLTDEARRGAMVLSATRHVLEAAQAAPPRLPVTWPSSLSEREVEVLRLVARGGTNKDVARALAISARTVQ